MAFKFPFTNYHELNLTWILDQLKALFEKSEENVTTIETYDGRLSTVEAELPVVAETAAEASRAAAAAGTLAQTAKTTADTAQNNAIRAQGLAGTARQEAQTAQNAANEATQAAQQAQATAQNFDGRITQAENDSSQALEASRSFENRVQSAITTANNANQTATNAQGIAMRADQNAGAALDKIGDLSDLTTTAKQNLVAAINEAAQSGGNAVSSVNGKTGAVVLDAGDIGYNNTTVEAALNGKQNAPSVSGTAGQVLSLNSNLQPVWADQTGGSGDNSNCAPLIINSVSSGSFSDGANNRQIRKIVGTVEFLQSGSGDPSPSNIRPISGHTSATLNNSNADMTNTQTLNINWQSEAGIVYGGTVTLNEYGGVDFVRTHSYALYDGDENWRWSTKNGRYNANIAATGIYRPSNESLYAITCNCAKSGSNLVTSYFAVGATWQDSRIYFFNPTTYLDGVTDLATFKAYIAEHPIQVVYPLDTPKTYHFNNIGLLYTYLGANNVWIDTGSITEVQYPADTKLYIDNKIAELQALVLEQ